VGVLRRLIEMVRASFPKAHSRAAKSSPASGNSSALQKKKRKSARQRTKLLVFTKKAFMHALIGPFVHKTSYCHESEIIIINRRSSRIEYSRGYRCVKAAH
jgi:hypothetical protein